MTNHEKNLAIVGTGKCETRDNRSDPAYMSRSFYGCTALLLNSSEVGQSGLCHIVPTRQLQHWSQKDNRQAFAALEGAEAIAIQGSRCYPNPEYLSALKKQYRIRIIDVFEIESEKPKSDGFFPFHIFWYPNTQLAYIFRDYFLDALKIEVPI